MTDALNDPVARELIAQVMPESIVPKLHIAPPCEGKIIGSLRRIPKADVPIHEMRVLDFDLKWVTFITEEFAYIVFFDEPDEDVREALLLEQRDLGLLEPPLSINEHLRLAEAYGVPEATQEAFKERVLLLLREQEVEEVLVCPKCGSRIIDSVGGLERMCRDCTFVARVDAFRESTDETDVNQIDTGEEPDAGEEGKRIRLISCSDPYTTLQPGAEGTISFVDDAGTLHVNWDDGSSLGLVPEEDEWEVLEDDNTGVVAGQP